MLDIQQKSMGLTFKLTKRWSLSIQGGKVTDIKFFLLDGNGEKVFLNNMEDDPQKFLGSMITENNSPADHFTLCRFGGLPSKRCNYPCQPNRPWTKA